MRFDGFEVFSPLTMLRTFFENFENLVRNYSFFFIQDWTQILLKFHWISLDTKIAEYLQNLTIQNTNAARRRLGTWKVSVYSRFSDPR